MVNLSKGKNRNYNIKHTITNCYDFYRVFIPQ